MLVNSDNCTSKSTWGYKTSEAEVVRERTGRLLSYGRAKKQMAFPPLWVRVVQGLNCSHRGGTGSMRQG